MLLLLEALECVLPTRSCQLHDLQEQMSVLLKVSGSPSPLTIQVPRPDTLL